MRCRGTIDGQPCPVEGPGVVEPRGACRLHHCQACGWGSETLREADAHYHEEHCTDGRCVLCWAAYGDGRMLPKKGSGR
jgi:hypothetical protein